MDRTDEINGPDYRRFTVGFLMDGWQVAEGVIAIHNDVINAVDDEWRSFFYSLRSPKHIAEHIAYNLCVNKWKLSNLDGFANFPDHYAAMLKWPSLDMLEWEVDASELT